MSKEREAFDAWIWKRGTNYPSALVLAEEAFLAGVAHYQPLLEQARGVLSYAVWQHEGKGTPAHNHWSAQAREMLAAINAATGKGE